ncbi:uncharacterized protein [Oryza sativa Japonica Group]|uniref:Os08g0511600 protein n=1 Tax=Oryza sativa subsp. japonica TaxID=39947 RepID=A0A0P0XIG6_ORYSJ|nr:uncharacterized protein LOC107278459 [Oryza sativa Japonica Group]XP_052165962.1 uncharacterized protein LOC127782734 [Oryza glaberrima]KAB8109144.1 hypothetical protein EE612_045306 [Oryza sativa]KAF2920447.1 hypothetical protein DAI22_08g209132 [Oryza sativa Japonica Group]BAT06203.1 Os08g0511600 [Oryza sativa Japonica Group]
MGVVVAYRKLSPASRRGGGAARAWVALLRRAAAGVAARLQRAARRRCVGVGCGGARRLTWAGLCVGRGVAVAAPARRISSAAGSYDPASYARNFDDGVWKAEEGCAGAARFAGANGKSSSNSR